MKRILINIFMAVPIVLAHIGLLVAIIYVAIQESVMLIYFALGIWLIFGVRHYVEGKHKK